MITSLRPIGRLDRRQGNAEPTMPRYVAVLLGWGAGPLGHQGNAEPMMPRREESAATARANLVTKATRSL